MTKPIQGIISFRLPEGTKLGKVSIVPSGEIIVYDQDGREVTPADVARTTQYDRHKGPKIQTRLAREAGKLSVGGMALLEPYDTVFAIDTNTLLDGEHRFTAACFIACWLEKEGENYRVECDPRVNIYEFRGPIAGNPELLAIMLLTKAVTRSSDWNAHRRCAIVTDTELSSHSKIASREIPLFGAFRLPTGFDLLYGSADTGRELVNALIKFCDRQSSAYLRARAAGGLADPDFQPLEEDPNVHFKYLSRNDFQIVDPVVPEARLQEGTSVQLYGRKA